MFFLIDNEQQATLMAELPYYLRLCINLWLEGGDSLYYKHKITQLPMFVSYWSHLACSMFLTGYVFIT